MKQMKQGAYTICLYDGKLKADISEKNVRRLFRAYIHSYTSRTLIECKYDPKNKMMYVSSPIYEANKKFIDAVLESNIHPIVPIDYISKNDSTEEKWTILLLDLEIDKKKIRDCMNYLKKGGIEYNNLLDYHIRGCSIEFLPGELMIVECNEDRWKIEHVSNEYILYHNNYRILQDGRRDIMLPYTYHLHGTYPNLRKLFYTITNYSYGWHEMMRQEGLVKSDRLIDIYLQLKQKLTRGRFVCHIFSKK